MNSISDLTGGKEPQIRVGILTDGLPHLSSTKTGVNVHNALIGKGFHWQDSRQCLFDGNFEILCNTSDDIRLVNILPLEQYLLSVIASEMNSTAPIQFLKAAAVISRSWAIRKVLKIQPPTTEYKDTDDEKIFWEESDIHIDFDVCNDDHCQRYQGISSVSLDTVRTVISQTRGEVLTDRNGQIADARFSKCCGGVTEKFSTCWAESDPEYLISRNDPWCDLSDMKPQERENFLKTILKEYDLPTRDFRDWEVSLKQSDIEQNIKHRFDIEIGEIQEIKAIERGASGRIKRLGISGSKGSVTIGKELTIRRLLHRECLYSSWFDIDKRGERFILKGHGWGHGVGLCQIGAVRMAHEGKNYREILEFYYPGTEITRLYE